MSGLFITAIVIGGIIVLFFAGLVFSLVGAWVRALFNGAPVSISKLIAMKLASIPYGLVVDARITAVRAGIELSADQIASHFQAGGNVVPTVQALISAQKAGMALTWDRAVNIDLSTKGSGKSVLDAVRTSVDPKVIDCPNPESGRTTIDGVAKDGIQVKVKARVTVRTNLDKYVGNAKEETIIARVGEGIVSTIGAAESYKVVLEAPDSISKTVLARGLDVGSAFEILSIDIADVDVGEN
ncbi:MAG TPA: flotillin-like FloA family protein, partial [Lacunisphaera sp.]|nr:flotillin-like FloA family protein [Lacunisphaera sp.]